MMNVVIPLQMKGFYNEMFEQVYPQEVVIPLQMKGFYNSNMGWPNYQELLVVIPLQMKGFYNIT